MTISNQACVMHDSCYHMERDSTQTLKIKIWAKKNLPSKISVKPPNHHPCVQHIDPKHLLSLSCHLLGSGSLRPS